MKNKMNPVVHFEMPYEDKTRMTDFYGDAFGWQAQMMGPEMGNYVVVTTTEIDKRTNFPKKPGSINGGFYKKIADPISHYPSIVIAVDDIWEVMERVKKAGGTVIGGGNKKGEPDNIPGVGLYISILDTEGNRVSLLQPSAEMSG
jgi:predicted enzyme related to lactoylglutathione lyase